MNERDIVTLTCCGETLSIPHAILKRLAWAAKHKVGSALDEQIPFRPKDGELPRATLKRLQDRLTNYRINVECAEKAEHLIEWLDQLPPF